MNSLVTISFYNNFFSNIVSLVLLKTNVVLILAALSNTYIPKSLINKYKYLFIIIIILTLFVLHYSIVIIYLINLKWVHTNSNISSIMLIAVCKSSFHSQN